MVDFSKLNTAVPAYPQDKILYANDTQFSVAAGAAGTTVTFTESTGIGCSGLPIGIYSYDDGASYNDLGPLIADGISSGFGSYAPTLSVGAKVDGDGSITFTVRREFVLGSPITLLVSYAILFDDVFLGHTFTPNQSSNTSKVAYSSSGFHRKIKLNDVWSGTSSYQTIAHQAGLVPMAAFWRAVSSPIGVGIAYTLVPNVCDPTVTNINSVRIDDTNAVTCLNNSGGVQVLLLARVYGEA